MATERTAMNPMSGKVIFLSENKEAMMPFGSVISEQDISVAASGRIMSSLANSGGLAGAGGIAGIAGGLAG